jgi:hypothetical protein
MPCRVGSRKKRRPRVTPRICRRAGGNVEVIGGSNAVQALEPTPRCEGAMPRKGGGAKPQITSPTGGLTDWKGAGDNGHITEEPRAWKAHTRGSEAEVDGAIRPSTVTIHCHDAKTREHKEHLPAGIRDKHRHTEERCEGKLSCAVLEQR